MDNSNNITYFAQTDSRNKKVKFGIKAEDRLRHIYSIGKTGMGKSTMLENMAIQDIQNGEGMAFLDPHGKTADLLLDYIPENRIKDLIYFAPFDIDFPISFNVMEDVGPNRRHLVASGLMSAFAKLFGEESFSDRMQYILQNTILALLEYPGATMLGINKMLVDKNYRNDVIANITDPSVKTYWTKEFAGYTERFAAEAIPAIQNKIGQFTSNPLIRNIIGQPKSSFDIRELMDNKKILIVNLSKGLVGENNANLLGSMIVTKIYLAAMSRADADPSRLKKLPNFYLYVDEFQSFANKSFADILSESRKYKLSLNITHQYIEQMAEEVRAAVFGNVGTMIAFRVGSYDAEILEKEFAPVFTMQDIVNLGFAQIYLRLMIDGVASQPFSATTLPPVPKPEISYKNQAIEASRKIYAAPKDEVERRIKEWHGTDEKTNNKPTLVKENEIDGKKNQNHNILNDDDKHTFKNKKEEKKEYLKKDNLEQKNEINKNKILGEAISLAIKEKTTNDRYQIINEKNTENKKEEEKKNETVSLKKLEGNYKNKEATPEHKNALKEALNKLKIENLQKEKERKIENKEENNSAQDSNKIDNSGSKNKKTNNEVPEEILRKILKGEQD